MISNRYLVFLVFIQLNIGRFFAQGNETITLNVPVKRFNINQSSKLENNIVKSDKLGFSDNMQKLRHFFEGSQEYDYLEHNIFQSDQEPSRTIKLSEYLNNSRGEMLIELEKAQKFFF